jgi:predicted nucleic acid-binding protein
MTEVVGNVFADTSFWIALVVKQDEHHHCAQAWSKAVSGRMITTRAVLLETANALSRPAWRSLAISLIEQLERRSDIEIAPLSDSLWNEAWQLFRTREDKSWSLTDCASFVTMQDRRLDDALTADSHFVQAGFRALLQSVPA